MNRKKFRILIALVIAFLGFITNIKYAFAETCIYKMYPSYYYDEFGFINFVSEKTQGSIVTITYASHDGKYIILLLYPKRRQRKKINYNVKNGGSNEGSI